jgi:hypothetical protein
MLHAPRVDVAEVRSRCGQAVEVAGWVRATGEGYYILSREALDPLLALHDLRYTVPERIYVLAESSEARKLEIGKRVGVRGTVVCDAKGAIQLEENELVALERP